MTEQPWRVRVEHGEAVVRLARPFRHSGTTLRGAIVDALHDVPHEAHVDWHNHADGDEVRNAAPRVFYRVVDGVPRVWAWGERSHEHLVHLARRLRTLRTHTGQILDVEGLDLALAASDVGVHKTRWYRYTITDYWPTAVALARRPGVPWARPAWAGAALEAAITAWYAELGLRMEPHRPVHVQVEEGRSVRLRWRGDRDAGWGVTAMFVSNAILPDGLGLGQHRSEGFGEVRRCP